MSGIKTGNDAELLQLLRPGMTVYIAGSSGEPTKALEILAAAPQRCAGINFITSFVPGINRFDLSTLGQEAQFTMFFMHPSLQTPEAEGRVRLLDIPYSKIARWLQDHPPDLVITQLSASSKRGFFSLGPAVEFMPIVLRNAAQRVAILNQQTPWLKGSVSYPISDFDLALESDAALPQYADPGIDSLYRQMGSLVAGLISNGATFQTGLGQAPAAVLNALHSHRNLKLHTGVFCDSLLRLIDAGSMDLNRPLLTGVAAGSAAFYARLKAFPGIQYAPVTQTHRSEILSGIKRFFTINSAIEVDLQGNLNAEYLGNRRFSGRGGLPDFVSGGHLSAGGASIIVLPSTDSSGTKTRIVKELAKPATVPGQWVDYVITEHGCASLKRKNLHERAAALCAIAAPEFKDALC